MKKIEEKKLKQIKGGFNVTIGIAIGVVVTFLLGVIDGYVRPTSCNE